MDKINVIPENVRGLGNVVIPKSTEDFIEYLSEISSDTESVNNVDMTVYSLNYSSTAISVTLTSSSSTITIGESVLLTATVTQGGEPLEGGTVSFYDGTTLLGTDTTDSNGVATYTASSLSVGTHSLTAKAGNVTSSATTVTVSKVTTTITLSTSSASVSVSETFTLSGTLSAGTGKSVKIYNGATLVDTVTTGTGGAYTKQLSESTAGTYTFTAVFDGDSTYANVTSSAVTVAVADTPTPSFDGITLTSDKSILSYADSEYATLSAQLTSGGSSASVSGETVTFEVRKSSDDSLVETLTGSTNSSGLATVSYYGKGSGDLYIKSSAQSITSTAYNIEDCTYYDSLTVDKSRYTTVTGSPVLTYSSNGLNVNTSVTQVGLVRNNFLTLPSDYEAEITVTTVGSNQGRTGICFDDLLIDGGTGTTVFYKLSNTSNKGSTNTVIYANTVVKVKKQGSTFTVYFDDVQKWTGSISDDNHYQQFRTYKDRSTTFKDLKIKAL